MAEQVRVTLDENKKVVKVEANVEGKWVASEKVEAGGGGESTTSGCDTSSCNQGTTNCRAIPGYYVVECMGHCYYFPC